MQPHFCDYAPFVVFVWWGCGVIGEVRLKICDCDKSFDGICEGSGFEVILSKVHEKANS